MKWYALDELIKRKIPVSVRNSWYRRAKKLIIEGKVNKDEYIHALASAKINRSIPDEWKLLLLIYYSHFWDVSSMMAFMGCL